MKNKKNIFIILFIFTVLSPVLAQDNEITLSGKVFSTVDNKPVEFATVVLLEAKKKTRTDATGAYSITVSEPGKYTLIIRSDGLKILRITVNLKKTTKRNFALSPLRGKGGTLIIKGERNIQKLSRFTLTKKEIKEIPATFGDSLGALTALPGVVRTGGLFGTLVIRGLPSSANRFYVDDILLFNPQHFFGIHSVIANDLISEIDLYQSAFPVRYGGAFGSIVQINSIDDVEKFGGNVDISIISASLLVKTPFLINKKVEERFVDDKMDKENSDKKANVIKKENKGYMVVAGRVGYLPLIVPLIYELVIGEKLFGLPQYWDYQIKWKYQINNNHSISFLAIGSRDTIDLVSDNDLPIDFDPILDTFTFRNEVNSFSQGFYYTYRPSSRFENKLLFYAALNDSSNFINVPDIDAADWLRNLKTESRPFIYSLKNKVKWEWIKKYLTLNASIEYTIYDFNTGGNTLIPEDYDGVGIPDFSDDSEYDLVPLGEKILNHQLSFYVEQTFTYLGFKFVPGVRFDYLDKVGKAIADPRGLLSYEFNSGTTISLAGGTYSSFYQANPFLFNSSPNFARTGKSLKPLKSVHSSLGIEQDLNVVKLRFEGYYNNFKNLAREDDQSPNGINPNGKLRVYGAEFMMNFGFEKKNHKFYGWINYSFTQSKYQSNIPDDPHGHKWINFESEQEHAVKLIAAYIFKNHGISARFQLNTSFPYTPIIGGVDDGSGTGRYVPIYYQGTPNKRHFPVFHRLDLRYTFKSIKKWGFISFYIEFINIYNNQAITGENWEFDKPYKKGSNPNFESDQNVSFIPNFGVEAKF